MWAAVFSGAIAIAPLDGVGCTTAGLGACSNALRLSAGMGDLMFEYNVQKGVQRIIERDENLPKVKAGFQGSGEQGLGVLSRTDVSSSELNAAQRVQGLVRNVELSPFAWGRWGPSLAGDRLSQPFHQASLNREVTVGSRYFALFRDQTEPVDLPFGSPVQYDFKLAQGQVHFVEKAPAWVIPSITPGTLKEGRLSVNFANQQISTYLNMSHPVGGGAVLDLTGTVDPRGIFTARDTTSMAAGALSQQGKHAGMLFERSVEDGVFHGISTWEKR
jgi:hypothetical protein